MARITYINPDGTRQSFTVSANANVMLTAVSNGVAGIIAECGGSAMCATCHVYVEEASMAQLPPMSVVEDEMLESVASDRRPNSRLGCQLTVPDGVEEVVIHVPSAQK